MPTGVAGGAEGAGGFAAGADGATGGAAAPEPFGVAVVGCGNISKQYLKNLATFPDVRVLFCADIDTGRAKAQAAAYGVPASGSVEQALEHPDVQLVVNLTIPAAHAEVASAAIAAGKHVWNEKPLAPDVAAGRALLEQARAAGVRVGCAPDTMLGAGIQSARRLIASGAIGTPISALTLLQGPGPESWHPDPEFLFAKGAGPLFDLGPYYLSVLATLFGPDHPGGRDQPPGARHPGDRLRARARVPSSTWRCRPSYRPWPSTPAARPPRCCSAGTRRCTGWASLRSPGPRPPSRCRTRTSSTATCGCAGRATGSGP